MRYYELNEEDKKKYGPILLDLIEERIKKILEVVSISMIIC